MGRIARLVVYAALLIIGISATPARLQTESTAIAAIGLICVIALQLRSTKNAVDITLVWVALWAVASVTMVAPLLPAVHTLVDAVRSAQ